MNHPNHGFVDQGFFDYVCKKQPDISSRFWKTQRVSKRTDLDWLVHHILQLFHRNVPDVSVDGKTLGYEEYAWLAKKLVSSGVWWDAHQWISAPALLPSIRSSNRSSTMASTLSRSFSRSMLRTRLIPTSTRSLMIVSTSKPLQVWVYRIQCFAWPKKKKITRNEPETNFCELGGFHFNEGRWHQFGDSSCHFCFTDTSGTCEGAKCGELPHCSLLKNIYIYETNQSLKYFWGWFQQPNVWEVVCVSSDYLA